jgi:hypothetical protein
MEKPLTDKQFKKKTQQEFIIGGIVLLFIGAGAYFKGCFSNSGGTVSNQTTTTKNSDSASSATINNKDVKIGEDQITAGRDAIVDKRKIEVKGDAFFDSAKKVSYYQGLKQRHIDLSLMKKILDSIPSKETKIQISAGGGKEGENLAKEISDYLVKRGYPKPEISAWSLTGNWDIIEYLFSPTDGIFKIDIHPQSNDQQIH